MPATIKPNKFEGLEFKDLRDGQIVEILATDSGWAADVGRPAQRVGDNLVLIGETKEQEYEDLIDVFPELRFRVLRNGEWIRVVDNE